MYLNEKKARHILPYVDNYSLQVYFGGHPSIQAAAFRSHFSY